jgi:hypothetical protein
MPEAQNLAEMKEANIEPGLIYESNPTMVSNLNDWI